MTAVNPRLWPSADGYQLVLTADFDVGSFSETRREVSRTAGQCGMRQPEIDDFTLAVNEIMTNAVRHGGGGGKLRLWCDGALLCEIADDGDGFPATAYLERTSRPVPSPGGGMGLWLARQGSAEVAIRSGTTGSTVRLRAPLSDRRGRRRGAPRTHGNDRDRQSPSPEDARRD